MGGSIIENEERLLLDILSKFGVILVCDDERFTICEEEIKLAKEDLSEMITT
jgi:hypothetical protein